MRTKWKEPPFYGAYPHEEYWNVSDLELWWNNAIYIKELVLEMKLVSFELEEVLPMTTKTIPYPRDFNKIERNLVVIMNAMPDLGEITYTREWRGGNLDLPLMGWDDWNRWFLPLKEIRENLEMTKMMYLRTSTYSSGKDFMWQLVGRWIER
jgi:hypothetical protein